LAIHAYGHQHYSKHQKQYFLNTQTASNHTNHFTKLKNIWPSKLTTKTSVTNGFRLKLAVSHIKQSCIVLSTGKVFTAFGCQLFFAKYFFGPGIYSDVNSRCVAPLYGNNSIHLFFIIAPEAQPVYILNTKWISIAPQGLSNSIIGGTYQA